MLEHREIREPRLVVTRPTSPNAFGKLRSLKASLRVAGAGDGSFS